MRAVAYLRVSTDEQAKHYGLDVQRKEIVAFARAEGVQLVAEHSDPGVSGTTALAERDGLSQALSAVKAGEAEALVVARPDRLARETLQALLIEKAFVDAGARVLYADGLKGEGDTVELMRTILHGMAQFEKRQVVARLAAGRRRKAELGGYAGGRPPFGYRARDGYLVPDEGEAAVVRWIFDRVAKDAWSVRRVGRALSAQGGKSWAPAEVHRILTRTLYKQGPKAPGGRVVDAKVWNRAQANLALRRKR